MKDTYPARLVQTDPVRTGALAGIKNGHAARADSRGPSSQSSGHRRSAAAPDARAAGPPPRPTHGPRLRARARDVCVGPSRTPRTGPRAGVPPRPGPSPGRAHPPRPPRSLVIAPAGHRPTRGARGTDRVACGGSAPHDRRTCRSRDRSCAHAHDVTRRDHDRTRVPARRGHRCLQRSRSGRRALVVRGDHPVRRVSSPRCRGPRRRGRR